MASGPVFGTRCVRKQTEGTVGLNTTSVTDDVIDCPSPPNKIIPGCATATGSGYELLSWFHLNNKSTIHIFYIVANVTVSDLTIYKILGSQRIGRAFDNFRNITTTIWKFLGRCNGFSKFCNDLHRMYADFSAANLYVNRSVLTLTIVQALTRSFLHFKTGVCNRRPAGHNPARQAI